MSRCHVDSRILHPVRERSRYTSTRVCVDFIDSSAFLSTRAESRTSAVPVSTINSVVAVEMVMGEWQRGCRWGAGLQSHPITRACSLNRFMDPDSSGSAGRGTGGGATVLIVDANSPQIFIIHLIQPGVCACVCGALCSRFFQTQGQIDQQRPCRLRALRGGKTLFICYKTADWTILTQ